MKAILVGLGGRGRGWLKDLKENPGCEVVACVEPMAENKARAVKDFGVSESILFDDLNTAVKKVKADFVVDVTPPAVHHKVAHTAFENGLHLLGEKPLSDKYEIAREVVDAGKRAGVKHMITQNYRWAGLPRTTKRLLDEGRVGPVGQLDVSLYVDWADAPGSHYVKEPYMFLTDMGIHHFDMMRYTLGTDCVSARAFTWNLPWGWHQGDACQIIIFKMANGVIATHRGIGCTMGHVPAGHNGEWRYDGPKGTLTWEGSKLFHTLKHKQNPQIRDEVALDEKGTGGPKVLLADFLDALKAKRQPECNAEDNLKSVGMVFAALKSAQEGGREVKLSEL